MNKCKQCSKDISQIEGKRTKLYCSDACRKAYKRKTDTNNGQINNGQPNSLTDRPLTDRVKYNPDIHERPLTLNEKQGITEYGKCHACKTPVSHLICICRDCTTKDITHESLNIDIAHCN